MIYKYRFYIIYFNGSKKSPAGALPRRGYKGLGGNGLQLNNPLFIHCLLFIE